MRLNAELVAREVARIHQVRVQGPAEKDLLLHRPELLETGARALAPNHLYVCRVHQLPQQVDVGSNVAIVVLGSSARLRWFRERCCVIEVDGPCDLGGIFNEVQRLYQRYAHWEEALWEIMADDASIQALLDASTDVLGGALDVLDSNLGLVACSTPESVRQAVRKSGVESALLPIADEGGNLNPASMSEFLSQHDLAMDVTEPFILDVSGVSTLNVNLLENGSYLGCLTQVAVPGSACDMVDAPVMALLADTVRRALHRLDVAADKTKGDLRHSLATLVGGEPLDALSVSALAADRGSYVCLKMRLNSRRSRLPLSYVSNLVEDNLPGTIAFVHRRSCVVAFSRLDGLAPEGERRATLERLLEPMSESLGMRVGVSDHLLGLQSARTYYLQAGVALENGMALEPERSVYRFQDFALPELVMNSLGKLPVEAYYTPGLRRLFEHDERSKVSYVETLERYLDLNMNVAATARSLYLHRSTLIERLAHIKDALGTELDDPNCRLRIQIVLAARRLERSMRS